MIKHSTDEIHVRGEPLSRVIWQGKQWAVTDYGIEKRDGTYMISVKQLRDRGVGGQHTFVKQIAEKVWADVEDFSTAFLVALAVHLHQERDKELLETALDNAEYGRELHLRRKNRSARTSRPVTMKEWLAFGE